MTDGIERKILKRLYRSYKEDQKVSGFPAVQIFRDFSIANGTDLSSVHKSDYIGMDRQENFYITNEGIQYMDDVFSRYEKLAGLVRGGEMVNRDKENRAFVYIDKEIEDKKRKLPHITKQWHERPWGIVFLTVIAGLIIAAISSWLGWP